MDVSAVSPFMSMCGASDTLSEMGYFFQLFGFLKAFSRSLIFLADFAFCCSFSASFSKLTTSGNSLALPKYL